MTMTISQMLARGGCPHVEHRAHTSAVATVCWKCVAVNAQLAADGKLIIKSERDSRRCKCGAAIGPRKRFCAKCQIAHRRATYRESKNQARHECQPVHS